MILSPLSRHSENAACKHVERVNLKGIFVWRRMLRFVHILGIEKRSSFSNLELVIEEALQDTW